MRNVEEDGDTHRNLQDSVAMEDQSFNSQVSGWQSGEETDVEMGNKSGKQLE